jgi:hypothetical protein
VAITITEAGTGTSTTSSTTLAITPTVSFDVNDTIVVCSAHDNIPGFLSPYISSVTDSQSNTYTGNGAKTTGGAGYDRATSAIYSSNITTALSTSDTITITFVGSITAKAVVLYKVSVASGKKANRRVIAVLAPSANITSLARVSQSMVTGEAVIMALAIEDTATVTGDSDTLNGSWSSAYSVTAVGGTATSSMQMFTQTKIVTANGSQTWNTSFSSADTAVTYAIFEEVSIVTTFTRTATGSGSGTATAATKVIQYRLAEHTDFSFPYRFGGRFYIGPPTITRTATGTGTGAGTATKRIVAVRTATGSGTGTSNNTIVCGRLRTGYGSGGATAGDQAQTLAIRIRTATASGSSSSTVEHETIPVRTATGSGAGSSAIVVTRVVLRTSSGTGAGSASTVSVLTAIRTATGSGTGTSTVVGARVSRRQATGAGQATGLADWVKSHIFRVPYNETYPAGYFGGGDAANRLRRYDQSNVRALNLYKLTDGTYTTVEQRDLGQVVKLWHGGRDHFLTDAEVVELTEAGFGASIS